MGLITRLKRLSLLAASAVVAACSTAFPPAVPEAPPADKTRSCTPVAADEPLVGNWLNKRQQQGVMGEIRTLFTLQADGRMLYTEQIKRPRQPSQGLNESGCWWRDGDQLVLHTTQSNGLEVDLDDPIYINNYRITHSSSDKLRLRSLEGVEYQTERTSPGYRLPF